MENKNDMMTNAGMVEGIGIFLNVLMLVLVGRQVLGTVRYDWMITMFICPVYFVTTDSKTISTDIPFPHFPSPSHRCLAWSTEDLVGVVVFLQISVVPPLSPCF